MSLLDTIKSLFCNKSCDTAEAKQDAPEPEAVTTPEVKAEPVAEIVPEKKADPAPEVKAEPVVKAKPKKKAKPAAKKKAKSSPVAKSVGLKIPEDSALKRHFISNLKTEIEAGMSARPTDSALSRHYDAIVAAEMDKLLG